MSKKPINNLSIIIPFYNEQHRLLASLKTLNNYFVTKKNIQIIFVNDGSTDKSNLIICKFIKKYKKQFNFKYIKYKKNIGKGFAIKKGILNSKKEWILICDADMSVNPNQIDKWVNRNYIKYKNIAYFGSRNHSLSKIKTSITRRFLGSLFNFVIYFLFKIQIKDTQCGFKLFNRIYALNVFKKLKSYRFSFDVELVILLKKNNIAIKELPIEWVHKKGSKLNIIYDIPKMMIDIIKIKLSQK
jgi:dolichyl-phosphate beta-glucosyltransferase